MSTPGTDNGNALGGNRQFNKPAAERMASDDVWAAQQCIEFGLMPNVLNKLFMLIARDKCDRQFNT